LRRLQDSGLLLGLIVGGLDRSELFLPGLDLGLEHIIGFFTRRHCIAVRARLGELNLEDLLALITFDLKMIFEDLGNRRARNANFALSRSTAA
jgi:hypothetical protein